MQPIHELLSRIRWDPAFGRARFTLVYADHIAGEVIVPLDAGFLELAPRGFFRHVDAEGAAHVIPLHRIRKVYRDDVLIWQRSPGGDIAGEERG